MKLSGRVKRLEEDLDVEGKGGIPDWAWKAAKGRASIERMYEPLRRHMGDEAPMKYQTEEAQRTYARELSEKYGSHEDYKNRSIDYSELRRFLEESEEEKSGE